MHKILLFQTAWLYLCNINFFMLLVMKKKLLCGIAAVAISATIAFNMSLNANSNNLSDLSLANVEALASDELLDIQMWKIRWVSDVRWICNPDGNSACPAP
jgi:hypothetical protein